MDGNDLPKDDCADEEESHGRNGNDLGIELH